LLINTDHLSGPLLATGSAIQKAAISVFMKVAATLFLPDEQIIRQIDSGTIHYRRQSDYCETFFPPTFTILPLTNPFFIGTLTKRPIPPGMG